jgi:hypothetical protein
MMELREASLQRGRHALLRKRCNPTSGMARLTSRQGRLKHSDSEHYLDLYYGSCTRIEELASLSIVCMITANLRATATAARLKPTLSRSLRPYVRRLLSTEQRVRMTAAAS